METPWKKPKQPLHATPEAERLVSAGAVDDDAAFELKLRPQKLSEFIGQSRAKEQLQIALEAARLRDEPLDHVLLSGPPGLGKTTLAAIIANEMGAQFQQTSGPAIQIQGFSRIYERNRCSSSTKYTACSLSCRRSSTRRSKTIASTL